MTLDTTNEKLGVGCYDYDGSTTAKTLLGATSMWDFIHTASAWAMSFWINISSVTESQVFNQNVNPPTNAFDYILLSSTNARLRVRGTSISYAHGFSADTWHHVVFTYDGTDITIYTDNTLKNTTAYTEGGSTGSAPITIAHSYVDSNHGDFLMDDMGIWERALTTAEISALYDEGSGALVSSLSDKSNLKAYYSFDTNTANVCPNDYSSTSPLDLVSGVRTNSIFIQTDDTPSYWWFSGSAWVAGA